MQFIVAVTDRTWFSRLRALPSVQDVNFWTRVTVSAEIGTPWLFKLKGTNVIAGGGYFAHYSRLPICLAWDAFELANGAESLNDLLATITRATGSKADLSTEIGCAILSEAFFWPEDRWLTDPEGWKPNIQTRRKYDTSDPDGSVLWHRVAGMLPRPPEISKGRPGFGEPILVRPRLGQGAFRAMVTDAYHKRCAVTGERTLPALEAAHIIPFTETESHEVSNGLLLRSDIHKLFDAGFVSITPKLEFIVSPRIRSAFENGRDYYALAGRTIALPDDPANRPNPLFLERHVDERFLH